MCSDVFSVYVAFGVCAFVFFDVCVCTFDMLVFGVAIAFVYVFFDVYALFFFVF